MNDFFKNSSIYFISQIANKGVSVLLFSYIARTLTVKEMGLYSLYILFLSVLSLILSLEIQSGFVRFYFEKTEEKREHFEISLLNLLFLANICAGLLLYFFRDYIFTLLFTIREDIYIIILVLPFLMSFTTIVHAKLRLENKPFELSILTFIESIINLVIVLFLFTYVRYDLFFIFISMIIKNSIAPCYYFLFFNRYWKLKINLITIKESLFFSINLIPATAGYYFSNMADKFMLNKFTGEKDVGIYSTFNRIASIFIFTMQPFYSAYSPIIIRDHNKINFKKDYYFTIISIFTFLFLIVLLVTLFEKELTFLLVGAKFVNFSYLLGYFLLIEVFIFITKFIALNIHLSKKSKFVTYIEVICGIINILLNYLLIFKYGLNGAVIATFLTFFLRLFIYLFIANNLFKELRLKFMYMTPYICILIFLFYFHTYLIHIPFYYKSIILLIETGLCILAYLKLIGYEQISIYINSLKNLNKKPIT